MNSVVFGIWGTSIYGSTSSFSKTEDVYHLQVCYCQRRVSLEKGGDSYTWFDQIITQMTQMKDLDEGPKGLSDLGWGKICEIKFFQTMVEFTE